MKTATAGDQVRVHYTIKLGTGKVVGSSGGGQPLSFRIGAGAVIKGLEQGVIGMQVNESRTIQIPPEDGYGLRNESLVLTIKKDALPNQIDLAPGRAVQYRKETGEAMNFIVSSVGEKTVTIDANHPFAGLTLTFEMVLVSIS
jgi:FKBP-type peptidyl-prolyl cis-trans isomerase 2